MRNERACFIFVFCVSSVFYHFVQCLREREVKNTELWAQRERERENEIEKQNATTKNKKQTCEGPELINHSWEHILKGMQRFHAHSVLPTLLDIIELKNKTQNKTNNNNNNTKTARTCCKIRWDFTHTARSKFAFCLFVCLFVCLCFCSAMLLVCLCFVFWFYVFVCVFCCVSTYVCFVLWFYVFV